MKKIITVAVMCAAASLFAAETIDLMQSAAWGNPACITEQNGVLTIKGKQQLFISKAFPVDPAKTYTITATCHSANGKSAAFMPIVIQYDAAGKPIGTGRVKTINGTFTELLAPVSFGAKTLLVKDAKLWLKKRLLCIAFNAKEDYSDLPNNRIAWTTVVDITPKDGAYQVTLDKAIPFSAPAGGIRQHHNGPLYIYPVGGRKTSGGWDKLSGKISGMARNDFPQNQWAQGAKTAKLGLLINAPSPDTLTDVKDLKIVIE
jgi:hypothetical protein